MLRHVTATYAGSLLTLADISHQTKYGCGDKTPVCIELSEAVFYCLLKKQYVVFASW